MNHLTVLVGLPASGKSTWMERWRKPDTFVYSPDAFVEFVAKTVGKTYDQVWSDTVKEATAWMDDMVRVVISRQHDVIWDQTNMSVKKRAAILRRFPADAWCRECVAFVPPRDEDEWMLLRDRLSSRPGKTIPSSVIQSMADSYVEPTTAEGFNYVTLHTLT